MILLKLGPALKSEKDIKIRFFAVNMRKNAYISTLTGLIWHIMVDGIDTSATNTVQRASNCQDLFIISIHMRKSSQKTENEP